MCWYNFATSMYCIRHDDNWLKCLSRRPWIDNRNPWILELFITDESSVLPLKTPINIICILNHVFSNVISRTQLLYRPGNMSVAPHTNRPLIDSQKPRTLMEASPENFLSTMMSNMNWTLASFSQTKDISSIILLLVVSKFLPKTLCLSLT